MRTFFLTIFSFCLLSLSGQLSKNPVVHAFMGNLSTGAGLLSESSSQISPGTTTGFSNSLDESYPAAGLGAGASLLFLSNYMVEANGFAFYSEAIENRIFNSQLPISRKMNTYGGSLSLGYVLYNQWNFLIYPSFGIGWMTVQKDLTNHNNSPLDYGPYELPPGESLAITLPQTLYDIKISALKLFPVINATSRIVLGLDIGYTGSFGRNEWASNEELVGSANLWYIKLKLGFGVFRR